MEPTMNDLIEQLEDMIHENMGEESDRTLNEKREFYRWMETQMWHWEANLERKRLLSDYETAGGYEAIKEELEGLRGLFMKKDDVVWYTGWMKQLYEDGKTLHDVESRVSVGDIRARMMMMKKKLTPVETSS